MSAVTIRWSNTDNVAVFVDGVFVLSASNDDDFPDEPGIGIATTAASAIGHVAKALGATVEIERATR